MSRTPLTRTGSALERRFLGLEVASLEQSTTTDPHMTAKPAPNAPAFGRQERGLAEETALGDDRSDTRHALDMGRGGPGGVWAPLTAGGTADRRCYVGTGVWKLPDKTRGIKRNRCFARMVPLEPFGFTDQPDRNLGSVRKRRAAVWAAARLLRSLTLLQHDERMSRYDAGRFETTALRHGEQNGKQDDGTPTDALEATHVPVGYENRTKALYIPDGEVYDAYHVPGGEIHLLPREGGTDRRLEEIEAGDVSVIA